MEKIQNLIVLLTTLSYTLGLVKTVKRTDKKIDIVLFLCQYTSVVYCLSMAYK